MIQRPYRSWLVTVVVCALIYYAWGQITQRRGNQTVLFKPAEQSCGAAGSLRYCIYRDRRGTNGDIVYHLHGRNLDERIWNDDTYLTAMLQREWQRSSALPPTVVEQANPQALAQPDIVVCLTCTVIRRFSAFFRNWR